MKLLREFFKVTIKDIKCNPNRVSDPARRKLLENDKRDAVWFVFSSKGYQGLEWWCDLLGVSSLRVKRRAMRILDKTEGDLKK